MTHYINEITDFFWQHDIYFRIVVSAVLGFIIGWDRSSKNKPAGLKTYTYVSVACTLITIVSIEGADMLSEPDSGKNDGSPSTCCPDRIGARVLGCRCDPERWTAGERTHFGCDDLLCRGHRNRHRGRVLFDCHLRHPCHLHHDEDRKLL